MCYGVPPIGLTPSKCDCHHKNGCKLYDRSRPSTLFEIAAGAVDDRIVKKSTSYTPRQLLEHCDKLSGQYGKKKKYFGAHADEVLDRVCAYCSENDIDAKIWLEAQFRYLGWFFAEKQNMHVPLNTCMGEKAAGRYNRFFSEDGREATGNVRKQSAADADKYVEPEFMYGHGVIVLELTGKLLRSYEKDIEKAHPDWDRRDWNKVEKARSIAATSILDQTIPLASLRICPPNRKWYWGELRDLIDLIRPR